MSESRVVYHRGQDHFKQSELENLASETRTELERVVSFASLEHLYDIPWL